MNTHLEILPQDTKQTFFLLKEFSLIGQFYLAGGTGAALHLGHRLSGDLDFFSQKDFYENALIQKISEIGKFQLEQKSEQTVVGILNDTKLSFLGYKYPLLSPPKNISGISVADIIDIACMKIDAISSRGTKRDFVDIYFIAKETSSIPEILDRFQKKYTSINYNMVYVKKSLVYFEDAENDPMPKMLKRADWNEIKSFLKNEILKTT